MTKQEMLGIVWSKIRKPATIALLLVISALAGWWIGTGQATGPPPRLGTALVEQDVAFCWPADFTDTDGWCHDVFQEVAEWIQNHPGAKPVSYIQYRGVILLQIIEPISEEQGYIWAVAFIYDPALGRWKFLEAWLAAKPQSP